LARSAALLVTGFPGGLGYLGLAAVDHIELPRAALDLQEGVEGGEYECRKIHDVRPGNLNVSCSRLLTISNE